MADDLDLDRVIRDPAYRRRVIARLNLVAGERVTEPEAENEDSRVSAAEQRAPD